MPVVIDGLYMDRSLHDFQLACSDCIENEQEKPLPDTHLIALLGDAIRLTHELVAKDTACQELVARLLAATLELRRLRALAAS